MSYHQPEKERSRELIWGHVISSLTHKRNQSTIVNPEIINEFTIQAISHIKSFFKNEDLTFNQLACNSDWEEFHHSVYQSRRASELRVAFFCGPEPINDIKHLLSRGVRQENIWGFELNKEYYSVAKDELLKQGIYINLFQGDLNEFIRANPQKFDIVYLDFTNSLLSKKNNPLLLINSLFASTLISDLSTIIINTCYPDKENQNIEFLSRYFEYKKWIHRSLYGSKKGNKFHESFQVHSIYGDEVFKLVKSKFEQSYSEFSSSIIDLFSNVINPLNRITKLPSLHKKIFNVENIQNAIKRFEKIDLFEYDSDEVGGYDLIMSADEYSYWHFIMNIISEGKPLSHFFNTKPNSEKFTPFELVKFYSLHHSIDEGYYDAFSKEVFDVVLNIQARTIEYQIGARHGGVFCDVPMTHLWYSMIMGKYGYPFHINYNNHRRYSYIAKTRKMCLDIYTIDQCRSLYDYIPSFEFIPEFFKDINRQLIIRCYIDKIYKTQFNYNDTFYSWGHLLFSLETQNAIITNLEDRQHITA